MAEHDPPLRESVVIRSLRRLRDRLFWNRRSTLPCFLKSLPVDIQFVIMTYLSPADLCLLGATCHYWRGMVRDGRLWRVFLLRDMPHWNSIDNFSMPHLEKLQNNTESEVDYMTVYLRVSPLCRQRWHPSDLSHNTRTEAAYYVMFGPGMQQLYTRLMLDEHVLPLLFSPPRTLGVGPGRAFLLQNKCIFNILTLDNDNIEDYLQNKTQSLNVMQMNKLAAGFIYVNSAKRGEGECEAESICKFWQMNDDHDSFEVRPLLVLSFVSILDRESVHSRVHPIFKSLHVAKRLEVISCVATWMVQIVDMETLSGLQDGISWLLRYSQPSHTIGKRTLCWKPKWDLSL